MERLGLRIGGTVQGVGFRPFLYRLAAETGVSGFARNTAAGVYAEVEGERAALMAFLSALRETPPPLSRVDRVEQAALPPVGERGFRILPSLSGDPEADISPDISVCDKCAAELCDPRDRRFRYPFLNCTDCGPRFTILKALPYDRANTTMAGFALCPACRAEYEDPANRRFHAQPTACPVCGPKLFLTVDGQVRRGDALEGFAARIRAGKAVAVKGLGGFHLVCDAENEAAVRALRASKRREAKPLAVMLRDVALARAYCRLSPAEERLLASREKPIVLLKKRRDLAPSVAPGRDRLGVMLPYTPLHTLLAARFPALVMTSANIAGRPMPFREGDLPPGLAEAVLSSDRPIQRRVDDSVAVVSGGRTRLFRRARGYVPAPLPLPGKRARVLALGGQQKSTFCLTKGGQAYLSGHMGDLDDPEAERQYLLEIEAFQRILDAKPELAVCDAHPDYISTHAGEALELPLLRVQHQRAHMAAVLAEHAHGGPALGFLFDGSGLGDDGGVWGGEALAGTPSALRRAGHLLGFPLPGGEAAIREPWRCALAVLEVALGEREACEVFPAREARALLRLGGPVCTSMGRLFDAAAALAGFTGAAAYEGQAAEWLEQAQDPAAVGAYGFELFWQGDALVFDWRQLIRDMAHDRAQAAPPGVMAARFHRACAALPPRAAEALDTEGPVVLGGGCFCNETLYTHAREALERDGYTVLSGEAVPVNDGGLSYGQAAIAALKMEGL